MEMTGIEPATSRLRILPFLSRGDLNVRKTLILKHFSSYLSHIALQNSSIITGKSLANHLSYPSSGIPIAAK